MKLIFIVLLNFFVTMSLHANVVLKVGVYQNRPMIFMDKSGTPSGFFVDILRDIAEKEGLELEYVTCAWSDCLEQTKAGLIDIMPDVAFTQERSHIFLFGHEPVITTWSVVYRHKDVDIDTLLDLDKKKLAVLKNTVQSHVVKQLINEFNVAPIYQEVEDYSTAFGLLKNHEVDSVVTNRFYDPKREYNGAEIVRTSIVMVPATMTFAFSTKQKHLPALFDKHIEKMKKNPDGIYHQSKQAWLEPLEEHPLPRWLVWSMTVAIGLMAILLVLVLVFRKMVQRKSMELLQKEEMMIVQSRHAAMGEMIAMIAHQWRQPLNIIGMSASNIELLAVMGEQITSEVLEKHLELVKNEVAYLSQTVDDFRDFFKPDKKKNHIHLSTIVQHVQKIVHSSLESYQISLIIHPEGDALVWVYQNEVMQVLINIINNAKDALVANSIAQPTITIRFDQVSDSHVIVVCDNAGGIPEAIMDKIGTQYFTTKEQNGMGLGLYMSKLIVENHMHGSLTWKNEVHGVCFRIALPSANE